MYDIDRPAGILTRKDRRYLYHDQLPESRQGRYERKKGCRERVANGLRDFHFIRWLPPDERRKLYADMGTGSELYKSLVAAVSVVTQACDASSVPLEELLEDGIELGMTESRGDLAEPEVGGWVETGSGKQLDRVDVNVRKHYRDVYFPEVLKQRWLDGDQLTQDELASLVNSDWFDDEAYEELQRRREEHREQRRDD